MSCQDETATVDNGRWICNCPGDFCDQDYQKRRPKSFSQMQNENAIIQAEFEHDRDYEGRDSDG